MSSNSGVPARFETAPVGGRRGSRMNRRAQSSATGVRGPAAPRSEGSDFATPFAPRGFAFGVAGPVSRGGSRSAPSYADVRARSSEPDPFNMADAYENYFIGSTKRPKNQNEILSQEAVSKVEKEEADKEYQNKLADAIKEALGTKKKPYKYKENKPSRALPNVLSKRALQQTPHVFWNTVDVNNFRTRKN